MIEKVKKQDNIPYIRVGCDYFKLIKKPDRFGIIRIELAKWNKEEIKQDHGAKYIFDIPKYDSFILEPNNNGGVGDLENCYNMYFQFPHSPKKGAWKWTFILLKHIFGTQLKAGIIYLQVLYLYPKQALPILTLVSEERQTGKTTFMDWLNMVFGRNMVMIEPDAIGGNFNGEFATANIIGIDETIIDKQIAVEKIKALATKKFISVNIKNVQQFKLPFFGKIILASNNEERFMKVDQKEIRFWVRRLTIPKIENHNILNDMIEEIPAFLNYLKQRPEPDFTHSRMVLTPKQIENEFLSRVKEESKSGLYHELIELFKTFFEENPYEFIEATPTDIKNKWFFTNNQISISYIKKTIVNELNLTQKGFKRYTPFGTGESKPGTPYNFDRQYFTSNKDTNENELPY